MSRLRVSSWAQRQHTGKPCCLPSHPLLDFLPQWDWDQVLVLFFFLAVDNFTITLITLSCLTLTILTLIAHSVSTLCSYCFLLIHSQHKIVKSECKHGIHNALVAFCLNHQAFCILTVAAMEMTWLTSEFIMLSQLVVLRLILHFTFNQPLRESKDKTEKVSSYCFSAFYYF